MSLPVTWHPVCVRGQPFVFIGGRSGSWAAVGGQFHCSSSLAWGTVWLLSSVVSLCGGYGG